MSARTTSSEKCDHRNGIGKIPLGERIAVRKASNRLRVMERVVYWMQSAQRATDNPAPQRRSGGGTKEAGGGIFAPVPFYPVYGKIRFMSLASAGRKFDSKRYITETLTISGTERRRLTLLVQKPDVRQCFGDKFEFLKIVKGEIRPSRGQIETLVANLDHA